jgi:hypothetical protein
MTLGRNKCVRCGEDAGPYSVVCYNCEKKEERRDLMVIYGAVLAIFLVILGIRAAWAKYAYDDYRCIFGECRIIK